MVRFSPSLKNWIHSHWNSTHCKNLDPSEVLKIINSDIRRGDKTKFLGVIFDEKLNSDGKFKHTSIQLSRGGGLQLEKELKIVVPQP